MSLPVKMSDRLVRLARQEAKDAHRSTTAQIEHWATLGRALEVLLSYGDVLALKRVGQTLPIPLPVDREDVHERLTRLSADADREGARARIRASGLPVYEAASEPGMIVAVHPDGTRVPGRLEGRRFVPAADQRASG